VSEPTTPIHQWVHDGREVLIVKWVRNQGETYQGFRWPLRVGAEVVSPNWSPQPTCESGGLFGWPWGLALGDGKDPDWSATWLVFGADPAEVVDLRGKVKAPRGIVRCVGSWWEATAFVLAGQQAWVAHAARGAASATGLDGRARSGPYGCVALAWWNGEDARYEMRCARVGSGDGNDGHLKAHVWYRLDEDGRFVESDPAADTKAPLAT